MTAVGMVPDSNGITGSLEIPTPIERLMMRACVEGDVPQALALIDDQQCNIKWLRELPADSLIVVPPRIIEQDRQSIRQFIIDIKSQIERRLSISNRALSMALESIDRLEETLAQERARHQQDLAQERDRYQAEHRSRIEAEETLAQERDRHQRDLAQERDRHQRALARERDRHQRDLAHERDRYQAEHRSRIEAEETLAQEQDRHQRELAQERHLSSSSMALVVEARAQAQQAVAHERARHQQELARERDRFQAEQRSRIEAEDRATQSQSRSERHLAGMSFSRNLHQS